MTQQDTATTIPAAALQKSVKKSLKRQDSGQMKLGQLAQRVADQHKDDDYWTAPTIQELILQSTHKFHVDDNSQMVTLLPKKDKKDSKKDIKKDSKKSKKRSSTPSDSENKNEPNNKKKSRRDDTAKVTPSETPTTLEAVQNWRRDNKIVVLETQEPGAESDQQESSNTSSNSSAPVHEKFFPWTTFAQAAASTANLHRALLDHCVTGNGFDKPSPIQAQAWPILVQKKDVVGIAETGSGKTLAFALPLLSAMAEKQQQKTKNGPPRMLVLSPTRELAMQSDVVLQEFGAVVGLKSLVVYGGVPKQPQIKALQQGNIDCLVATPGRLKDLVVHDRQNRSYCDLSQVQYLVLDEADRMLDSGFEEEVRFLIQQCRPKQQRQTAMFSATWPAEIQRLALDFMTDPVRVYVGFESIVGDDGQDDVVDDSLSANPRVTQTIEVLDDRQRERRLRELLKQVHQPKDNNGNSPRVLIFALYKKEAERLEQSLKRDGWNCNSIHGNKNQQARTAALAQFKDGTCPLLVATDVAARGLDIPHVETVINFTFPLTIEDYVHRIGRTGRAGRPGVSVTFFQPTDKAHAGALQQVLRQVGQSVPEELAKFGSTIKKKEHKLYGNFGPKDAGGGAMKKASKITFNYDSE